MIMTRAPVSIRMTLVLLFIESQHKNDAS